uniref:uncharacterized protein n=1 Tax=Myxine glutinosa TaxID=7769 RepID=UPI00358F9441
MRHSLYELDSATGKQHGQQKSNFRRFLRPWKWRRKEDQGMAKEIPETGNKPNAIYSQPVNTTENRQGRRNQAMSMDSAMIEHSQRRTSADALSKANISKNGRMQRNDSPTNATPVEKHWRDSQESSHFQDNADKTTSTERFSTFHPTPAGPVTECSEQPWCRPPGPTWKDMFSRTGEAPRKCAETRSHCYLLNIHHLTEKCKMAARLPVLKSDRHHKLLLKQTYILPLSILLPCLLLRIQHLRLNALVHTHIQRTVRVNLKMFLKPQLTEIHLNDSLHSLKRQLVYPRFNIRKLQIMMNLKPFQIRGTKLKTFQSIRFLTYQLSQFKKTMTISRALWTIIMLRPDTITAL